MRKDIWKNYDSVHNFLCSQDLQMNVQCNWSVFYTGNCKKAEYFVNILINDV